MFGQNSTNPFEAPFIPPMEWQTNGQIKPFIQATPIWDSIDAEVTALTDDQKLSMNSDAEYVQLNNQVAALVQQRILQTVKPYIEATEEGKQLLQQLLTCTRRVKAAVITADKAEMEEFRQWKANKKKK